MIDLLFAASLDQIPDEPEFLLEYAYQTPSNLYVKNKGAGKLSRVSQFAKFNHSFSAPEMLPERFSYENGEEREENLPSEEQVCGRIDVWLFGCILFNLVTGTPPFYESDVDELIISIKEGHYKASQDEIFD